jgi:hypothetical protein
MRRTALTILMALTLAAPAWAEIHVPRNRAVIIPVGPLVNFADGVTPVLNVTPTNVTCELVRRSDAGGAGVAPTLIINTTLTASGGTNDLVLVVGSTTGRYGLELTAAQVSTVGEHKLTLSDPDVIAPWFDTLIVDPNTVYDSLRSGTDTLPVDMTQILGTAVTEAGGAGRLAASVSTWGDVATPVATAASANQTGDAYGPALAAQTAAELWNTPTKARTILTGEDKALAKEETLTSMELLLTAIDVTVTAILAPEQVFP